MHYLSPEIVNAERLSPTRVPARVKAGWSWVRLVPGFGAAGGTASYSRALVAPDGRIAFVSDRADGMSLLDSLPPLEISYRLVRLSVPFAEKDAAKAAGAVWVGHEKTWACAPACLDKFKQWINGEPQVFDLLSG